MAADSGQATIYHNPKCSTSRKTLDLLRDSGFEPEVVHYLKTPPSRDELVRMISDAGIEVRAAVRKRESLYTELNLADAGALPLVLLTGAQLAEEATDAAPGRRSW